MDRSRSRPATGSACWLWAVGAVALFSGGKATAEPVALPYKSRGPFVPVLDLIGGKQQGLILGAEEAVSGRPAPISIGNATFVPLIHRAGETYGGYTRINGDIQVLKGEIYLNDQGIGASLQQLQQQTGNQQSQLNQQQNSLQSLSTQANGTQQSLNQTNQTVDSLGQVSAQHTSALAAHRAAIDGLNTELNQTKLAVSQLNQNMASLGQGVAGATALAAALSSLPTDADGAPVACGIGSGGYSTRYALAMGCSASLNSSLSVNAGGAYLFGGASSYGAGSLSNLAGQLGLSYRFGHSTKGGVSEKQALERDIQSLQQQNNKLANWIAQLENRINTLQKQQQPAAVVRSSP